MEAIFGDVDRTEAGDVCREKFFCSHWKSPQVNEMIGVVHSNKSAGGLWTKLN